MLLWLIISAAVFISSPCTSTQDPDSVHILKQKQSMQNKANDATLAAAACFPLFIDLFMVAITVHQQMMGAKDYPILL